MEVVAETMRRWMEVEAKVGSCNYSDEPPYGVVESTRRIMENTMVKWYLAVMYYYVEERDAARQVSREQSCR